MKKLKVGCLTTFYNFESSYSLVTVVRSQLEMLMKNGYEPVLFVLPSFKDDDKVPEGVEIRKVIPQFVLEPYGKYDLRADLPDTFERDADIAKTAFLEHMKDIQVMFTHDVIFINSFLIYNKAMRDAIDQGLGHIRWLHWCHSGPSLRPSEIPSPHDLRYSIPPNSKLIYMNHVDALRMAEMYAGVLDDVRVVKNPMDLTFLYNLHPLVEKIYWDFKLYDADVVQVYPLSTPRMESNKQLSKVIKIFARMKEQGKSVRLVVPNAHANADNEKNEIERMLKLAESEGLTREEVIFTSLIDEAWAHGIPHEAVRDLFLFSNVFVFPSVSENCPLVLLEAAAAKNILVLNGSFPAMRDFFGEDAIYFEFGSSVQNVQYKDESQYLYEVAMIIIGQLSVNRALKANTQLKKFYNLNYLFKEKLEPLFYEDWDIINQDKK